jgi:hypothetical protein
MAPIANIARLNRIRFTDQEIADLMLAEDRARRRALEAGDVMRAAEHDAELTRLQKLLSRAA